MKGAHLTKHATNREFDFKRIKESVSESIVFSNDEIIVVKGDSLPLLRQIPSHSVSLILTDPPYHTTKKENIMGDTDFENDREYVKWLTNYSKEWKRILKQNGSLFCFSSSAIVSQLVVAFSKRFNILSEIVWTKPNDPGFEGWKQKMNKEALRQWYPHSERIIFAEPSYPGNLSKSYFGTLLSKKRKKTGLSMKDLAEKIGAFGNVNHGGSVSNWEAGRNIPSRDQYQKLCSALIETKKVRKMPPYEDVIRPFATNSSEQFTDVWDFKSVRPHPNKHPAEKPLSLLEHAIKSTTYEGDIVLDCFSGSGNTALAAIKTKRKSVIIELDQKWIAKTISMLHLEYPETYP
ncbi:MAG: site-specific DNA-methyltransferase [Thermoplasmataceae archaeon]|jgi:site-specific DNA-methyltransferase (adenine-specific)